MRGARETWRVKEAYGERDELDARDETGPSTFDRGIVAASALVSGALTVGDGGRLCVGSACVDTVAFGRAVRASARVEALAVQTLASSVFAVNSTRGNSELLPSQSVVALTYVGVDYDGLVATPSKTAAFAAAVGDAARSSVGGDVDVDVVSVLAGSAGGSAVHLLLSLPTGESSDQAADAVKSLMRGPPAGNLGGVDVGPAGKADVVVEDLTAAIASHLAVFATWGASSQSATTVAAAANQRDHVLSRVRMSGAKTLP